LLKQQHGPNAPNGPFPVTVDPCKSMEDYEELRHLGRGAFGEVTLVRSRSDGRRYAVKRIRHMGELTPGDDSGDTAREVRVLQSLHHPGVLRFYGSLNDGYMVTLITEYADSGDLQHLLRRVVDEGRRIEDLAVLSLFTQLADAVRHVHSKRVLHRDLKPSNVLLTSEGLVKLGDFGVAKVLAGTAVQEGQMTFVGSPIYMAPEVVAGEQYGAVCDVWSLGVILYELVALRKPFEGRSLGEIAMRIMMGEYEPLESLDHSAYESLVEVAQPIVARMLVREVSNRANMDEVMKFPLLRTVLASTSCCRRCVAALIQGHADLDPVADSRAKAEAKDTQKSAIAAPGVAWNTVGLGGTVRDTSVDAQKSVDGSIAGDCTIVGDSTIVGDGNTVAGGTVTLMATAPQFINDGEAQVNGQMDEKAEGAFSSTIIGGETWKPSWNNESFAHGDALKDFLKGALDGAESGDPPSQRQPEVGPIKSRPGDNLDSTRIVDSGLDSSGSAGSWPATTVGPVPPPTPPPSAGRTPTPPEVGGGSLLDANREAVDQCKDIAHQALSNGDFGKAERFLQKAKRMQPKDVSIDALLGQLQTAVARASSGEPLSRLERERLTPPEVYDERLRQRQKARMTFQRERLVHSSGTRSSPSLHLPGAGRGETAGLPDLSTRVSPSLARLAGAGNRGAASATSSAAVGGDDRRLWKNSPMN